MRFSTRLTQSRCPERGGAAMAWCGCGNWPDIRFHHSGRETPPWSWRDFGGAERLAQLLWCRWASALASGWRSTSLAWPAGCTWRLLFFRLSTVAASLPRSYCPPAGYQRFNWMRDGHGPVTELSADGAWPSRNEHCQKSGKLIGWRVIGDANRLCPVQQLVAKFAGFELVSGGSGGFWGSWNLIGICWSLSHFPTTFAVGDTPSVYSSVLQNT